MQETAGIDWSTIDFSKSSNVPRRLQSQVSWGLSVCVRLSLPMLVGLCLYTTMFFVGQATSDGVANDAMAILAMEHRKVWSGPPRL